MSDSTYANESMDALGKNKDSSGVYFDKNGNAVVESGTTLQNPTVDIKGAIANAFSKLRKYPSYRLIDGDTVGILSTEFGGNLFYEMAATDEFGKPDNQTFKISFEDNNDVEKYQRDVSGILSSKKMVNEWRLAVSTIGGIINGQSSEYIKQLEEKKKQTETDLAQKKQNIETTQANDVQKVCDLLGLSKDDAIAYLAAGHTVKDASDKVTAWNLADPSQRAFMIAQDGLNLEKANKATEFKAGSPGNNIVYKGKETDDLFKGIRLPFEERKATKAYIALVKDNLLPGEAISAADSPGVTTLLKLQHFFMQSVNEVDSEKYQIVETFNKPKIYFFDRRARIYQYSFIVDNSGGNNALELAKPGSRELVSKPHGNPFRDLFKNTYEEYLRGTKSVENRVKAVIHYDGVTRIGYVLSCSMSMDATNDNLAQVSITMFVEDEQQRDIKLNVNKEALKNVAKAATVEEAKKKTTDTAIYGTKNGSGTSQTIVCDNILNPDKPGRSTFPPAGSYVSILLTEIPKGNEFTAPGTPTSGDVSLISKNITVVVGNNPNNNNLLADDTGVFLCTTTATNTAIKDKIPFTIPVEGSKAFVVVDTASKSIQDLYVKNPDSDIKLTYNFSIQAQDNPNSILRIQGAILLKKAVLDIKVVLPNKISALDVIVSGKTIVKVDTSAFTSSFGIDKLTKVYKGSFDFNLVDKVAQDKVAQVNVALPTFESVKAALSVDTIKGSISTDDKGAFKENSIVITPKDANVATCDITITAVMNGDSIQFTGESCIIKGVAKIGITNLNIEVKFIREKDTTSYNLLGVYSLASDSNPFDLNISYTERPALPNVVTLFFDADPGLGIGKLIQFDGGSGITDANGKGSANLNVIGKKRSSYGLLGISSNEAEFNNPSTVSNVTLKYMNTSHGSLGEVMSTYKGLVLTSTTATDIWYVNIQFLFTINGAFLDLISAFLVANGSTPTTNEVLTTRKNAKIDQIKSSGKISIAKTKHTSGLSATWNNTNEEYFGIAG